MKRTSKLKILVVDIGGSHVKCRATGRRAVVQLTSGPSMNPTGMMEGLRKITAGWDFNAVSVGYPGVVVQGKIAREPHNLASGWVGFDFDAGFGRPVKIVNDAAMQALGAYKGGKMLFLGLGTGLGSALIVDGMIAAMELGHLRSGPKRTYEDLVGEKARQRLRNKKWRKKVTEVLEGFRNAMLPDYIVLGGGNVRHLKRLPPQTRLGGNADAFAGGFRLWDKSE